MKEIRLAIIEDDELTRSSLKDFFGKQPEVQFLGSFFSVESFLAEIFLNEGPTIILLDINLIGMSGLQGIPLIREKYPDLDIIMLTASDDSEDIYYALSSGAVSYISKTSGLQTIRDGVVTVSRGGAYMSPMIARKVIAHFEPKTIQRLESLTSRQEEIVQGLVDGLSYKMIADKLDITLETVRDHIKKIYKKLEVNSKAEVIRKKMDGII